MCHTLVTYQNFLSVAAIMAGGLPGRPSSTHSMINRRKGRRSVKTEVRESRLRTATPVAPAQPSATSTAPPTSPAANPQMSDNASESSSRLDLMGSSPAWDATSEPSSDFDLPPLNLDFHDDAQEDAVFVHEMPNKRYRVSSASAFIFLDIDLD
jgi:hypothetical protein